VLDIAQWLLLIGFKHQNLFDVKEKFENWKQEKIFHLENWERFVLYSLCGFFLGIVIILISVIVVLYIERRRKKLEEKNDYQTPRTDLEYNDILSNTRPYIPIYRYNGRTENGFYNVWSFAYIHELRLFFNNKKKTSILSLIWLHWNKYFSVFFYYYNIINSCFSLCFVSNRAKKYKRIHIQFEEEKKKKKKKEN